MAEEQMPNQESVPTYNVMPHGNGSGGKNIGSVIGIILIVLVLILGGLYFWGKRLSEESSVPKESSLMPIPGSTADEMIVVEEGAATEEILPESGI